MYLDKHCEEILIHRLTVKVAVPESGKGREYPIERCNILGLDVRADLCFSVWNRNIELLMHPSGEHSHLLGGLVVAFFDILLNSKVIPEAAQVLRENAKELKENENRC